MWKKKCSSCSNRPDLPLRRGKCKSLSAELQAVSSVWAVCPHSFWASIYFSLCFFSLIWTLLSLTFFTFLPGERRVSFFFFFLPVLHKMEAQEKKNEWLFLSLKLNEWNVFWFKLAAIETNVQNQNKNGSRSVVPNLFQLRAFFLVSKMSMSLL